MYIASMEIRALKIMGRGRNMLSLKVTVVTILGDQNGEMMRIMTSVNVDDDPGDNSWRIC
jgi:hypothetical protein